MGRLRILRFLIAVLPAGLVLAWGLVYLRLVISTALAPGLPFSVPITTPGGKLTLKGDSFNLRPGRGFYELEGVRLLDPSGHLLASAKSIQVTAPPLMRVKNGPFHVKGRGVFAKIIRSKTGTFQLQNFIHPSEGPPTKIAYDVDLKNVQVEYEDLTGAKPYRTLVSASSVSYAASEGNSFGAASAWSPQLGHIAAQLHIAYQGPIQLTGTVGGLHLASIPDPVKALIPKSSLAEVNALHFEKAAAAGRFAVLIPPKGPFQLSVQAKASGTGVRWNQLQAQTVSWDGAITESGAKGTLLAQQGTNAVTWQPSADWSHGAVVSGPFQVKSSNLQDALAAFHAGSVKGLDAHGLTASGFASFDSKQGLAISGQAAAGTARYQKWALQNASANFTFQNGGLRFKASGASPRLGHINSAGYYAVKANSLKLYADASVKNLQAAASELAPKAKLKQYVSLKAPAVAHAIVSGPLDHLTASFRAESEGSLTSPDTLHATSIQGFDLVGDYAAGKVSFKRIWLKTDQGAAWASGTYALDSQSLKGNVDVRGLDLSLFHKDVSGLSSFHGTVSGPLSDPSLAGTVEAYHAQYEGQGVTAMRADLNASLDQISLSQFEALREASLIKGDLGLDLKTNALSGHLEGNGLRLFSFTNGQFEGAFDASIPDIHGTIQDPAFTFQASAKHLIADSVAIDSASISGSLEDSLLTVGHAEADIDKGSLTASGKYSLKSHEGSASAASKGLDISSLLAEALPDKRFAFEGTLDGTAAVKFNDTGVLSGDGTGDVSRVSLNQTPIGQGPWSAHFDGKTVTGSIQIADQLSFLALENGSVTGFDDPNGPTASGTLLASQISLKALHSGLAPLLADLPASAQQPLTDVDGSLQAEIDLSGPIRKPSLMTVQIPELQITGLNRAGTDFGSLTANGGFANGTYTLNTASYSDGPAAGTFSGSFVPGKNVQIDGELDQFDLTKLATFFPQSPALRGIASLSFIASGSPEHPDLRGSLLAQNITYGETKTLFGLNLDQISYENGSLTAGGDITYNGFSGRLTALAPFSFTQGFSDQKPLSVSVTLPDRPITAFAPYFPEMASQDVTGTIGGHVSLDGTFGNLALSGEIKAKGSDLAFKIPRSTFDPGRKDFLALKTKIKEFQADALLADGRLTISGVGSSSMGGSIAANAAVDLSQLNDLINHPGDASTRSILSSPLSGTIALNRFTVNESNPDFTSKGSFQGSIDLGGTIRRPSLEGGLTAINLESTIPALNPGTGTSERPLIDPQFSLKGTIDGQAKIRTAVASLGMTGSGTLTGSMTSPSAHADLTVASGSFRLPGGIVRLTPGGSVTALYADNGFGIPTAQLLVDIPGETHITSAPAPDQIQRYDVSLEIKGDLLDPNNVQILASSDPPDLSQAEILNILGRTDILTAFNGGQGSSKGALQNVVTGYALPSLLEPLTNGLASSLGLDYLSIDYDPLGQTSLLAGKAIGGGFSLSLIRQISSPLPGMPTYYDYRLNYRPGFFGQKFRRFSFLLGTDYQRAWKVGLQYSIRF